MSDNRKDNGSMKKEDRDKSLQSIRERKSVKIILISFKAGSTGLCHFLPHEEVAQLQSTGLNLTACNNVILVDLWWNPALEVRTPFLSDPFLKPFLTAAHPGPSLRPRSPAGADPESQHLQIDYRSDSRGTNPCAPGEEARARCGRPER